MTDLDEYEIYYLNLYAKYNVPYTKPNKAYDSLVREWVEYSSGRNKTAAPCWFWYNVFTAVRRGFTGLRVQLDSKYWSGNVCGISYRGVQSVLKHAEEIGYVIKYTGNYKGDVKYETVFKFTQALLDTVHSRILKYNYSQQPLEDVIVVKSREDKTQIEHQETDEIETMKNDVLRYNDNLAKESIEFNGSKIPMVEYKRSFSGDLYHGGRLYVDGGGVQIIPAEYRKKYITIGGEKVVELDYSANHPNILYELENQMHPEAMKGFTVGFDPYGAEEVVKVDNGELGRFCMKHGIDDYNPVRNLYKLALMVMLNAKDMGKARQAINHSIFLDRKKRGIGKERKQLYAGLSGFVPVGDVMRVLEEHNAMISHHFYRDIGLRLQNIDSNIALSVIDYLVQCGHICLAYHDSFLVKESNEMLLDHCMRHAWCDVLGSDVFCKIGRK